MGFYIFDSHEVGAKGKLARVQAIPGVMELATHPLQADLFIRKHKKYPVCWVDNGTFEGVGVVYDDQELRRFVEGMDGRYNRWFLVPTEELVKLKPHLAEYLRGERSWRE